MHARTLVTARALCHWPPARSHACMHGHAASASAYSQRPSSTDHMHELRLVSPGLTDTRTADSFARGSYEGTLRTVLTGNPGGGECDSGRCHEQPEASTGNYIPCPWHPITPAAFWRHVSVRSVSGGSDIPRPHGRIPLFHWGAQPQLEAGPRERETDGIRHVQAAVVTFWPHGILTNIS